MSSVCEHSQKSSAERPTKSKSSRRKCDYCGRSFEPRVSHQRFCQKRCKETFYQTDPKRRRDQTRREARRRQTPVGRVCVECRATDSEVTWSGAKHLCATCHRWLARGMYQACAACGTKRTRNKVLCPKCCPNYVVRIILIAPAGDRERSIYRVAEDRGDLAHKWARELLPRDVGWPLPPEVVVTATPKQWARYRR